MSMILTVQISYILVRIVGAWFLPRNFSGIAAYLSQNVVAYFNGWGVAIEDDRATIFAHDP
jgi:hypothetical protein